MAYLFQHSGGEFVANTAIGGDQVTPKIVALTSGGFVMVWADLGDPGGQKVKGQLFDSTGTKVGAEFVVGSGGEAPDVSALPNGGFAVTWSKFIGQSNVGYDYDIVARIYDGAGVASAEFTANEVDAGSQIAPQITTLPGGGFAILWNNNGQIEGRIFDSLGAPSAGEFAVTSGPFSNNPQLASLADGRLVATWSEQGTVRAQILSATGTKIGSEMELDGGPYSLSEPNITALSTGGFAISWTRVNNDIEAQIFDAAGDAVGGLITVNTTNEGNEKQSTIIGLPDGGFLISWADASTTGIVTSTIRGQAFNADGSKSGSEFVISRLTDSGNTNHNQPSLALLESGNIVAAWHGSGPGDPRTPGTTHPNWDGGIRAQIFSPLSAPTLDIVPSTTAISEIAVEEVAAIKFTTASNAVNGVYSYTLLSDSSGGAFRIDGDRLFVADNDRLDFETAPTISVTVRVTDHAGNSIDEVIQLTVSDVAVETRYAAAGELVVNTQQTREQLDPVVTELASGGFVVVWTNGDHTGDGTGTAVKAQIYDSAGNQLGAEFLVNTWTSGAQEEPSVTALSSGGFVVGWNSEQSVRAQIFDAAGTKVGGEFQANTTTSGFNGNSSIASLAGGGFVVSWIHNAFSGSATYEIRAQLFDSAGTKIGGEITANTVTTANQTEPSVAAVAGGGFVVSWTDASLEGGDASSTGIKAQLFDANGAKVGGETLVNTTTSGGQNGSAVLALGTGYVIVWAGGTIRGQIFDSAGNKVGAEFQVASSTSFDPSIASVPSGGFVVSWSRTSHPLDGSLGAVVAQLFDSAGNKVGSEFLVNEETYRGQDMSSVTALDNGSLVFAWRNLSVGNSSADISARIFSDANAPLARDDDFLTVEGQNVAGNVFSDNGSGSDGGNALQVVAVEGSGASVGQQITLASGALLTLNANGSFSYDQNGAFAYLVAPGSGASNERGFETFTYTLAGGTIATVTIEVTGIVSAGDQYHGSVLNDTITGTSGADLFLVHQGTPVMDTVIAGDGDDVIYVGASLQRDIRIDGGAGNDVVQFHGEGNLVLWAGNVANVERVVLLSSHNQLFGGGDPSVGYQYEVTVQDSAVAPGATLIIDASDLRGGPPLHDNLTLNAAAESDGNLIVIGGAANNNITTGAGADTLIGGAAFDALFGGGGADSLDGGAGPDYMDGGAGDDLYHVDDGGDQITEAASAGTDTVLASATYTLSDNVEFLTLTGTASIDGTGNGLANIITGNGGNNVLDGAAGADLMVGGLGDDTYVLSEAGDSANEQPGGGTDTVRTSFSYTLGDSMENLVLLAGAITGTGNGLANVVTGNSSANMLDGMGGADGMAGGLGDDIYIVDNAGDSVTELASQGSDEIRTTLAAYSLAAASNVENLTGLSDAGQSLTGNGLANIIKGGWGNDLIDGGTGADDMRGSLGDDVYLVDNAGDTVTEGDFQGLDEVRTNLASFSIASFANVENLTGGAGDQTLTGNGWNNRIDGGAGADTMAGGGGHDVYVVDNLGDVVVELDGAGIDEIRTNLGSKAPPDRLVYVLPNFIENLTGTSAGAQGVRDNALSNVIVMGVGHDLVVADAGGIDTIDGGGGNDFIYYGDKWTAADITNGGLGTDTIGLIGNYASGIVFTGANLIGVERMALYTSLYLPGTGPNNYNVTMSDANVAAGTEFFVTAASLQSNESLAFNGSAEMNGKFTVHGGAGNDTISGGTGSDFFLGNAGNDAINGGGGNDFLNGGLGADQLTGGGGFDAFRYQSAAQSTGASMDHIIDFTDLDRIDLSAIDADGNAGNGNQAFTFIGSNGFGNVAGQLRAYQSGANWFVEGDTNGDGIADLVIQVTITDPTLLGLGASDFNL